MTNLLFIMVGIEMSFWCNIGIFIWRLHLYLLWLFHHRHLWDEYRNISLAKLLIKTEQIFRYKNFEDDNTNSYWWGNGCFVGHRFLYIIGERPVLFENNYVINRLVDHRSGDLPRIAGICDRVLLLNSWCKHVSIKFCGNILQLRKRISVKSKDCILKIHDLVFWSIFAV